MYDFDLEDWTPADDEVAEAIEELCLDEADLRLVAAQMAPDGSEQFLALADSAAPYAHGGYPGLRAVHIARDPLTVTVRVEYAGAATLAHAESWLLDRGADPDLLVRDPDQLQAADLVTREIEHRTREAGNRLRVVEHFTDYDTDQGVETWILMHDDAPVDAELPFVAQVEQELPELGVYSVREGCFPDRDTAMRWITSREGPLPTPTAIDPVARPQAAARSRTATSPGPGPAAPTVAHTARQPVAAPLAGPGR